jgi:biotin-(acetyl-CoA carboxylase) ligase
MGPEGESVGKSPAATDLWSEMQAIGNFGNSRRARPDRNRLAAELARSLAGYLKSFEKAGFAQFADEWNCAHAYRGERMQLIERGQVIARGVAREVDAAGRLCIETPEGVRSFLSGDVSLRPA